MSDPKGGSGAWEEPGGTDESSKSASAEPDRSPQGDNAGGLESDLPGFIVGVGASAGGLEAFTELLRNLPIDTGMASFWCSTSIRTMPASSQTCWPTTLACPSWR